MTQKGVPSKPIDWEFIGKLFITGSNITQAAAAVRLNRDTLYDRCPIDLGVTLPAYYQQKFEEGNTILYNAQYEKAVEDRNPTMLIWLGKQRLGQKENLEDKINEEIEKKFDERMGQILRLISTTQPAQQIEVKEEDNADTPKIEYIEPDEEPC